MTVRKKNKHVIVLFGSVCFLFMLSIAFLYYKTTLFSVTSFSFEGVSPENKEELLLLLSDHAKERRFFFLRNNSVVTPDEKGIRNIFLKVIPSSKNIQITPMGLHTLHITVEEYEPIFLLRNGVFLDEQGTIFSSKKTYANIPTLQLVASSTFFKKEHGVLVEKLAVPDRDFLTYSNDFSKKIRTVIFPVGMVTLDEYGDVSFFDVDGFGVVKLTKSAFTKKTWTTFISAVDTDPLKSRLLKEKDALNYIDVRFGSKVFYSFGEGNFLSTSSPGILTDNENVSTSTTQAQ